MKHWQWTLAELTKSAEAYGVALTEARVRVYVSDFERLGLSDQDCARAIASARSKARFFPSIAEVLAELEAGGAELAAEAWARVWPAVGCHALRLAVEADPDLRECVRLMGGWKRLGETAESAEPFEAKRFAEIYAGVAKKIQRAALTSGDAPRRLKIR